MIPLYRKELQPTIDPSSLLEIKVHLLGDYGTVLQKNLVDGLIYDEKEVAIVLRVSNKSEYPITIEDVVLKFVQKTYTNIDESEWIFGHVYTAGADVEYDLFVLDVSENDLNFPVSVFKFGRGLDISKYMKIVYKIPPFETEYIPFVVRYTGVFPQENNPEGAQGFLINLDVILIVKGKESKISGKSPVHILVTWPRATSGNNFESWGEHVSDILNENDIYSEYQKSMNRLSDE